MNNGLLLWADDEMELLRAHLLFLEKKGYEVVNIGTDSPDRFDYPVSGYRAAKMVASGEADGETQKRILEG